MWKLISKFVPFLSSLPSKLIIIAGLVTTLTTFAVWGYNNIYEAGYNEAALQYQTEMAEKVMEEINLAKLTWQIEADKAIAVVHAETKVKEVVRTVYKDVYRTEYVCNDIGENALELLNRVFDQEAPNVSSD